MTLPEPMLRSILENYADDGPRLVAADWLEQHGECDRAEFVRVQCELGNVVEPHVCGFDHGARACWVCRLRRRADALLAANEAEWMRKELGLSLGVKIYQSESNQFYRDIKFHWHRGWPSQVECRLADFAGDPCPNGGSNAHYHNQHGCHLCHGTGRTPGMGAVLLRRAPIERVVVTDREAYQSSGHESFHWYDEAYRPDLSNHPASNIQSELYRLIDGPNEEFGNFKEFPSADAANAALSDALIKLVSKKPEPAHV